MAMSPAPDLELAPRTLVLEPERRMAHLQVQPPAVDRKPEPAAADLEQEPRVVDRKPRRQRLRRQPGRQPARLESELRSADLKREPAARLKPAPVQVWQPPRPVRR
jgi:hypothetical protein